jgi:glycosyltransferase involved in cell wall biosynthesis
MHIGIDIRLPFYQMGGISRYILQLVGALAEFERGHVYTLFHSRKDDADHRPRDDFFRRHDLWTPSHHRYERWLLGLELIPHRLDVFHSPDFIPPAFGAKRRIITVHDLSFLHYPDYLTDESRRYYLEQIDWAVREADHIAADSEHTRKDLLGKLGVPAEKVTTIHLAANPVYEEEYSPAAIRQTLTRHGLPRGFILFVGTLEPRKNISTLLRAYRVLRQESDVDVPLVLVGSKGWLYDDILGTIDELFLRSHVHHLEGVDDGQLAHLYHAAGVLALPSHYEGFGLPVLEAMHCGCPVLSSDRGSLPEIVGSAGLLLEADDVEGWVDALENVLCDEALRAEMIAAGYRNVQQFTWERTARATLELYEQTA